MTLPTQILRAVICVDCKRVIRLQDTGPQIEGPLTCPHCRAQLSVSSTVRGGLVSTLIAKARPRRRVDLRDATAEECQVHGLGQQEAAAAVLGQSVRRVCRPCVRRVREAQRKAVLGG